MRILAVDDDHVFLELLAHTLEPNGLLDLVTRESADEALELISEYPKRFDCFLLDIAMPGKDGIFLCRAIRSIEGHQDTPIIMITGSSDIDHIDKAFSAGATDYLSKPLQGLELGARIRVASLLHEQSRRLARAATAAADRTDMTLQDSIKCFEGELAIRSVPGIRDLQCLENDLLRLPQGNYNLAVFALKVEGADMLFNEFGVEEFRHIMRGVARSVAEKLDLSKSSFAYAGKGTFAATLFGRDVRSEMRRLHNSLRHGETISIRSGELREIEFKTVLAESKTPHIWNGRNAADALRRAIDQAEASESDIRLQQRLDAERLTISVRPRRHRIDFKRFCSGLT